jgi:hypothetical protein
VNVRTAIERAVPLLAQYGNGDQAILLASMLRDGIPRAEAEQAIRFVPLAFARDALDGMGVTLSDTYLRITGDSQEERPLQDEPFYREALALAPYMAAQFGFDAFEAVTYLSSEFQAINSALNAGASAENLVASPPAITWPTPPEAAKRAWWKVWG